ncbi:response regulator receiver protein [Oleidesulfovibrio alaskensis G20]|jgi:two-component system KDP operon response regulator KdpE|uniref:Response regulator receiver protein n=1 Tax=Oleidesulfovibrio alaskensis (strain ATCC BAA-1058 / DSM 17464 / G20) TaxID=207559 RepID=Q30YB6_OLEA2|nr:response regulator [Oleidesulfovibrio alaskensis]ABB39330.1 response regulator receiver protein [Oleidesulfovibrio alaskensis G20]
MATILIADDDPVTRTTLSIMLEDEDHEVYEAADSAETLDLLETTEPHVVFMDMVLPDCEAGEGITRVRRAAPAVTIIAMTGQPDTARFSAMARDAGCKECLIKPFEKNRVLALTRKVLAARGHKV